LRGIFIHLLHICVHTCIYIYVDAHINLYAHKHRAVWWFASCIRVCIYINRRTLIRLLHMCMYIYTYIFMWTDNPCHMNESWSQVLFRTVESRASCHTKNESCHARMSHVNYKWVMSRIDMNSYGYELPIQGSTVTSHINESCHLKNDSCLHVTRKMSHVTYKWVMPHTNMNTSWNKWHSGQYSHMGWLRLVGSLKS